MKKYVVFDFDGTLTIAKKGSNSWYNIWNYLDALDEDEYLFNKYKNGEFDYNEWVLRCIDSYKTHNLDKSAMEALANNVNLINDIAKIFQLFNKLNIKIYIMSQGVKNIIDLALKDVSKYISDIQGVELFFDENDIVSGASYKIEDKQDYIQDIIAQENCNPDDILFVGNGQNDETVYKTGVETLCLNADDTDCNNKTFWTNSLETDSLSDILRYVLPDDYELNVDNEIKN